MKCRIEYEDEDIIVVYKPAGIAAETASVTQTDMVSELKKHLKGKGVYLVHRLDQPVEGLLAVGKNKRAAAALSKQLQEGKLKKTYAAVAAVCGNDVDHGFYESVKDNYSFELTDHMIRDPKTKTARIVSKDEKGAEFAHLKCHVIKVSTDASSMTCSIEISTGRFHQIRAQMAHAGFPLLGDKKYGNRQSLELSEKLNVKGLALCADSLEFIHPSNGRKMNFEIVPRWV